MIATFPAHLGLSVSNNRAEPRDQRMPSRILPAVRDVNHPNGHQRTGVTAYCRPGVGMRALRRRMPAGAIYRTDIDVVCVTRDRTDEKHLGTVAVSSDPRNFAAARGSMHRAAVTGPLHVVAGAI